MSPVAKTYMSPVLQQLYWYLSLPLLGRLGYSCVNLLCLPIISVATRKTGRYNYFQKYQVLLDLTLYLRQAHYIRHTSNKTRDKSLLQKLTSPICNKLPLYSNSLPISVLSQLPGVLSLLRP